MTRLILTLTCCVAIIFSAGFYTDRITSHQPKTVHKHHHPWPVVLLPASVLDTKPFWTETSRGDTYEIKLLSPGEEATERCTRERWMENKEIAAGMQKHSIKELSVNRLISGSGTLYLDFSESAEAEITREVKHFLQELFVTRGYEETRPADWTLSKIVRYGKNQECFQIYFKST